MPGNLRENVVVALEGLQSLASGTVLQMGEAMVRLTFRCEPCSTIKEFVNPKDIANDRGYLGQFLNSGTIRIGDVVKVDDVLSLEKIPHTTIERLRWFLTRHDDFILASDLVWQCGLSAAYTRALPAILRKISPELQRKVIYKKDAHR